MTDEHEVLHRFSANWAESLEGAMRSIDGRVLRRSDAVATNRGRPAGLQNSVVLLKPLRQDGVQSLLPELNRFFDVETARTAGTIYLFSAWPVPDLAHFDWKYTEQMPLMVRQPGGDTPPAPPELTIAPVRTATDLHHFERVMIEGFPVPDLQDLPPGSVFGSSLLSDQRFRFWLGWHDGHPVSASAAFISHGLIDVIFLATLPHTRGRGFGSALAWCATLARPELPALLIASQEGQPLYSRMGYEHLQDMPLWIRERP